MLMGQPSYFSFGILVVLELLLRDTSGYDNIEGFWHDTSCIEEDPQTRNKCHGTILDYCTPSSEDTTKVNKPETAVFLFARERKKAEFLHKCGGRLPPGSGFDPGVQTEIIIHGGTDGVCHNAWMREFRDQLFIRGKYNVMLIDWTWGNFEVGVTISNTKIVGEQVACVVNYLVREQGADLKKFHIIAHSFGASVAGVAGYNIPGLARITGLDPAYINRNGPRDRILNKQSANLVDIIHTDGGPCVPYIGVDHPMGHADFYPNGGNGIQLACYPYILYSILKGDIYFAALNIAIPMLCPHYSSVEYYKTSINPCDCYYVGVECPNYLPETLLPDILPENCRSCNKSINNCAVMGMDFDKFYVNDGKDKVYYLETTVRCPYCDNSKIALNGFPGKPESTTSYCKSFRDKLVF